MICWLNIFFVYSTVFLKFSFSFSDLLRIFSVISWFSEDFPYLLQVRLFALALCPPNVYNCLCQTDNWTKARRCSQRSDPKSCSNFAGSWIFCVRAHIFSRARSGREYWISHLSHSLRIFHCLWRWSRKNRWGIPLGFIKTFLFFWKKDVIIMMNIITN